MKSYEYISDNELNCKEISTNDDSSTYTETRGYIILKNKSNYYLFAIIYFITSLLFLLSIIFINILDKRDVYSLYGYEQLSNSHPSIYCATISIIAISGFLNIWFLCSVLSRRFSVPELKHNKAVVNVIYLIGTFSNIIFTFFGFINRLHEIDNNKNSFISLTDLIFASFIFFNIISATLCLKVMNDFRNKICKNDKKLKRNLKFKKISLYLSVILISIYLIAASAKFYNKVNKTKYFKNVIDNVLFITPMALFAINAIINLSYYIDIRIIEESINVIVDKEFFLNDETTHLISQLDL